jgi:L-ascorbate metabolism protein UlaG (beta-lactamase superfamily)
MGESPGGERLERIQASPHYRDGEFENEVPTNLLKPGSFWDIVGDEFFGDAVRTPPGEIPVRTLEDHEVDTPPDTGLRVAWMGWASTLIEIDGMRVMTDPVFSERASPFGWAGPARHHPTPIALERLPRIDVVVISHDHYDHLDMETVQALAARDTVFVVGLGIGAHLESWGLLPEQIVELDWWEQTQVGQLTIVSTPARHYSGRGLFDGSETLWSSWTLIGPATRLYYSGDTGYSDHFARIAERHGPFDMTIVKIGAYDENWLEIHMSPEQAVDAQLALGGGRMLPVHWLTFDLAPHAWDEPIRRAVAAAEANGVELVTPRVGEWVVAGQPFHSIAWWEEVRLAENAQ